MVTRTGQENGKVGYLWRVGNKDFIVERANKPISELKFDPRNQRIQYALRAKGVDPVRASQDQILEALQEVEKDHITGLYWAIYEARGLLNPLVVADDGIVQEGNCRLAALHRLCADYPNEEFCSPSCEVLPAGFDEEARLLYLGDCHVAGKQKWDAYEIAEHVYRMVKQFGKTQDFLAHTLRMSKSTVNRYVEAYEMHTEFLHQNPDPMNLYKWSYFFEFQKKKPLRELRDQDPTFQQRFFNWVRDGKIKKGEQVRELPNLIDDEEALKALDKVGMAEALEMHARKVDASMPDGRFPVLEQAIHQLEGLPMRELERLSRPESPGAIRLRELHRRLLAVARMAGISLEEAQA